MLVWNDIHRETARNLEVRINEHEDKSKQSEQARHIKEQPNHKFTWSILGFNKCWKRRRINEAMFIKAYEPELNKQIKSYELKLFPRGIRKMT